MKKLLTPKKGHSGIYEGRSVVGWRGFILADTENSEFSTPLFHNKLQQVTPKLEFPDHATSADFMTRLRENLKQFDAEKHDFEEFYCNQVQFTAESYHAELTKLTELTELTEEPKTKRKARGA